MSRRYEVASVLAEGGQGRVYRASDRITGNKCVLKTGNTARDEAILALQLNHPYIAKPFDAGIDPSLGQYAAYPEYTETPLLQWSKDSNKADLQRVVLQISEVLAFLHRRGWLYHDFKPEHFLVGSNRIRVLDLGLAQKINENSHTFSGTFPYISPERLTGRKCDARSDIFALGMLLLHILLPNEVWDFEPSIETLQHLQKQTSQLAGFWKHLLKEMTCLEPAQRIESAAELWKRLLPKNAQNNFLFFPMPLYFDLPPNLLQTKRITMFQTASDLNISEIEGVVLRESWEKNYLTATFDFRNVSPEEVIRTLCCLQLDTKILDPYTAIESLHKAKPLRHVAMIFLNSELLDSAGRAFLSYILTTLQNLQSMHFVLLEKKRTINVPEESALRIEIPIFSKCSLRKILPQAFPSNGLEHDHQFGRISDQNYILPDQIIADLRCQLSQGSSALWPASAKEESPIKTFASLTFNEIRILGCLALSKATIPATWIFRSLHMTTFQGQHYTEMLRSKGLIQTQNDRLSLVITPQSVLKRLRKDRKIRIAESLMLNAQKDVADEILFNVAYNLGNKRLTALHAIHSGRKFPKNSDTANEWYLNAFQAEAQLPKSYLYNIVDFSIRTARHNEAKHVLHSIRGRFGRSFKLAYKWIDLYWRISDYDSVSRCAKKNAELAELKGATSKVGYFTVVHAAALTMQSRYGEAEAIFKDVQGSINLETNKKLKAFLEHYMGVARFYTGKLQDAVRLARSAIRTKHPMQSMSFMNLGIFLAHLWRLNEAEKWFTKAARIFLRQNDSVRWSYTLSNLGLLYKRRGKIQEARQYYLRSLHLSRIHKNHNLTLANLTNLSESYEIEGCLRKALQILAKAKLLAKRKQLIRNLGFVLTQSGRLYSILGDYKKSILCLKQAIKLRRELQLDVELAESHEIIAQTYLFSGHVKRAVVQFSKAIKLFERAKSTIDWKRAILFRALSTDNLRLADETYRDVLPQSFEAGLYHYLAATLKSKLIRTNDSEIRDHLHEAERLFRNVPSLFWLGRVLRLKAEYYLNKDHLEKARMALESAYNIFSRLGAKKEILKLNRLYMDMKDHFDLLNKMAERLPFKVLLMVKEVLSERNAQRMIDRILSTSIEFTDMERAALILLESPPRIFKSATLDNNSVQEVLEISQSALEEAAQQQRTYISLNADGDSYLKSKPSIIANRIRSILCLPLRSSDRTIGVLYLDSKEGIESIAKTESILLEIFSNIISLVLEDAVDLEQSKIENEILKRSGTQNGHFPEMFGKSKAIDEVRQQIYRLQYIRQYLFQARPELEKS